MTFYTNFILNDTFLILELLTLSLLTLYIILELRIRYLDILSRKSRVQKSVSRRACRKPRVAPAVRQLICVGSQIPEGNLKIK